MFDCEVNVFILWSTEGALKGIYVAVVELFGQDCSASSLLLIFIEETAIFEWKPFEYLTH